MTRLLRRWILVAASLASLPAAACSLLTAEAEVAAVVGGAGGTAGAAGASAVPERCWSGTALCDPRTPTVSCGPGAACDFGEGLSSGALGLYCFTGGNEIAQDGACDPRFGPYCAPGLRCSGTPGTCQPACCENAECDTGRCVPVDSTLGTFGHCSPPTGGAAGASGAAGAAGADNGGAAGATNGGTAGVAAGAAGQAGAAGAAGSTSQRSTARLR